MNDVTAVPARIVVIGTSKKKLAERFKDLSPERSHRVSRKSSPGAESRKSSRPPPKEPKITMNFLHDQYMDNDLFSNRRSKLENSYTDLDRFDNNRRLPKRPMVREEYLSDVSEEFDEEVVNLPAHMPRRQRQIDVLYNGNGVDRYNGNGVEPRLRSSMGGYGYANEESPMRPRFPRRQFVYVNRSRFRPMKFIPLPKRLPVSIPLEERISILRKHNQMPFQFRGNRTGMPFNRARPNLKRLQHFIPRDRERFGGRRFLDRTDRRNNSFGGGRRQYSENNNHNPRAKMSTTELDQELDEYMKSSKHPRIAAVVQGQEGMEATETGAGAATKHPRI